jgi:hypothetical protein
MLEVENGVEMPAARKGPSGREEKYGFSRLQPGQSVFIADESEAINARRAASAYGKRHGMKMTSRKVDGGFRIWRVG